MSYSLQTKCMAVAGSFLLSLLSIASLPAQSARARVQSSSVPGGVVQPSPVPLPPAVQAPPDRPFPGTIRIQVDATDVRHRILSINESIPTYGGEPITLLFPQWTPGDHTANGPLEKLAGLVITSDGESLRWTRDSVSAYAFHIQVPPHARSIELTYQYLGSVGPSTGPALITGTMLDLQWQSAILYPAGFYAKNISFSPGMTLPTGWQFFSALEGAKRTGNVVEFAPVSLDILVDSPVMAGLYARQVSLSTAPFPVFLDVVADDPSNFARLAEAAEKFKSLQVQTSKLFQSHHFNHYDHMLWLSDDFGPVYYEHHRSGENSRSSAFLKGDGPVPDLSFIEHGYVHSWNGMFRRPAEMSTADFNTPERDAMFWVFEGLTEYWADVLSARAGMSSKADVLQTFGTLAAYTSITIGSQWRPLQDVNNAPVFEFRKAMAWPSWQRTMFDSYTQGELIWLGVDTLIRQQSKGTKSLDDFARSFFAGREGSYDTATYTFGDMVIALNHVWPYPWQSYLRERLDEDGTQKSLDGITSSGYKLAFLNKTTPPDEAQSFLNLAFSLGMQIGAGAKITAVHWQGPAFQAGLIPGGTITTVNDAPYTPSLLESAVGDATKGGAVKLAVKRSGVTEDFLIDWHGGLRQPQLVRDENMPAILDSILEPL